MQVLRNPVIVEDYLESLKREINVSPSYAKLITYVLQRFNKFINGKDLRETTQKDMVSFLDSLKKPEPLDPMHKWIGTYNTYFIALSRFFKWLYNPSVDPNKRPKPEIMKGLLMIRRKEKSAYKPTDLWTAEDDILFLKYCPSKRDRCYHMMSRDSSCRPHELLKLKIKDIVFKMVGDKQYAEVLVNGKTGQRHIPLINSIPYLKDWLDDHPQRRNPNAAVFYGNRRSLGKGIGSISLYHIYMNYKTNVFPRLLLNATIPPEDKRLLSELLKKPWNPYIRRHTALTEKSKFLKESVLRQHAGWTNSSGMPNLYLHYLGNESSESILEAYGLRPKHEEIDKMKPKQCTNCLEPNKPDASFCVKCRMILSYDAYTQAMEENQDQKDSLAAFADKIIKLTEDVQDLKARAFGS